MSIVRKASWLVEAKKAEDEEKPIVVPTFSPLTAAMRSSQQAVVVTFLAELDDTSCVRVDHDGVEKVLFATATIKYEIRNWMSRGKKITGCTLRVRYRGGVPRPEVEIRSADGGLL